MKRNLLGVLAVVLAIGASSYTVKKNTMFYLMYDDAGTQKSLSSYDQQTVNPGTFSGIAQLAWIRLESVDAIVETTEFEHAFDALDETAPTADNLNDESEKSRTFSYNNVSNLQTQLEKKGS